jgi:hypothetical protein
MYLIEHETPRGDFQRSRRRDPEGYEMIRVPAPKFEKLLRCDNMDKITLSLSQNGEDLILFRRVVLESSKGDRWQIEARINVKDSDILHVSKNAYLKVRLVCTHKLPVLYRAYAVAIGGKRSDMTIAQRG